MKEYIPCPMRWVIRVDSELVTIGTTTIRRESNRREILQWYTGLSWEDVPVEHETEDEPTGKDGM